jgi:protein-S-isoprenylcysteine O-methyltransferase Ste14
MTIDHDPAIGLAPGAAAPLVAPVNQNRRILVLRLTFIALVPLILFTRSAWSDRHWIFEAVELAGVLLVIAGVLGRLWSILYIGGRKNAEIMQDGPYSMCRHPLYLFSTIGVIGFGLMLGSFVIAAVCGGLTLLILHWTAAREETYLHHHFGPAYREYAARVPRILPRPGLFRTAPVITVGVTQLRRNFFDALVFLSLIPIAEVLEGLKQAGLFPTFSLF